MGKVIHIKGCKWGQKENSYYDEALEKSNLVEIFGICADTSQFSLSFKRKKSHKEIIATLTEQKGKNSLAEINFTSNNLDRDFE